MRTDDFDQRLNMTNICLKTKMDMPSRMKNFSPINFCNVGYKVNSKVFYQRLKKNLPKLISKTQPTFVLGRLTSDNILIAQEMFHRQ